MSIMRIELNKEKHEVQIRSKCLLLDLQCYIIIFINIITFNDGGVSGGGSGNVGGNICGGCIVSSGVIF